MWCVRAHACVATRSCTPARAQAPVRPPGNSSENLLSRLAGLEGSSPDRPRSVSPTPKRSTDAGPRARGGQARSSITGRSTDFAKAQSHAISGILKAPQSSRKTYEVRTSDLPPQGNSGQILILVFPGPCPELVRPVSWQKPSDQGLAAVPNSGNLTAGPRFADVDGACIFIFMLRGLQFSPPGR